MAVIQIYKYTIDNKNHLYWNTPLLHISMRTTTEYFFPKFSLNLPIFDIRRLRTATPHSYSGQPLTVLVFESGNLQDRRLLSFCKIKYHEWIEDDGFCFRYQQQSLSKMSRPFCPNDDALLVPDGGRPRFITIATPANSSCISFPPINPRGYHWKIGAFLGNSAMQFIPCKKQTKISSQTTHYPPAYQLLFHS